MSDVTADVMATSPHHSNHTGGDVGGVGVKSGGGGSGPHLPHLFKWIKQRASSKKENRYATKGESQQQQQHGVNVAAKIHHKGKGHLGGSSTNLYNKTALVSRSSDNIHRIKGTTELSDFDKAKVLSFCTEFHTLQHQHQTPTHKPVTSQLKSESMVTLSTHHVDQSSTQPGSDVICKHGAVQRTCRACMQLPPLPPGHERVLRDLQRQEKKRIRNTQKAAQSGTPTGNNNINNAPHVISSLKTSDTNMAVDNKQTGNVMDTPEVVPDHQRMRVRSPLSSKCASSPENVYEEIPGNFFRGTPFKHQQQYGYETNTEIPHGYNQRKDNQHTYTQPTHPNCHANMHSLDNRQQSNMAASKSETRPNSRQVSLGNLDFEMAKECDGFLVVPLRDKQGGGSPPVTQPWQHNNNKPNHVTASPQQNAKVSTSIKPSVLPQQQSAHQSAISHNPHFRGSSHNAAHVTRDNNTQNATRFQSHNAPAETVSQTSRIISHNASVSGHKDQNVIATQQHQQGVSHDTSHDSQMQKNQTSLSRDLNSAKNNMAAVISQGKNHTCDKTHTGDSQQESYSHCKRCKRPHGLYHGVSLCHSDVEDLRQELQYLDIAGLDKHKLRGTTAQSSPSMLLHNIAHRRSAFSKYIPSPRSRKSSTERSHSYVLTGGTRGSVARDHSVDAADRTGLTTDAYKRQSMSAESDYFSSNYNTSQSDTTTSRDSRSCGGSGANYVTTSEKSNDTFSEYDIQPDAAIQGDVLHPGMEGNKCYDTDSLEYQYYLAKARHHNMLKNNVKRIIRSSESERSDAERSGMSDSALLQEDTISLTSVTSLSEMSTFPNEELMDRLSCRVHHNPRHQHHHSRRHANGRESHHSHHRHVDGSDDKTPSPVASGETFKPQTRSRKPIRKKRQKANNKMEYYKLPNFSGGAGSGSVNNATGSHNSSPKHGISDSASISDTISVSSRDAVEHTQDLLPVENLLPAEEHVLLSSPVSSEKLSVRVTDFKLSDIRRSDSKCSDMVPRNLPSDRNAIKHSPSSGDLETSSRCSVYSNHGQIHRNTNNRLLSDLMRMNHDRQLFSLL